MRAAVVVFIDEFIKQHLELLDRGRLDRLGSEPFLECLLKPFDFALGGWVVWFAVLLGGVEAAEFVLEAVAAALASDAGEADVNTMLLSVTVEAGIPAFLTAWRNSANTIGVVRRGWAVTRTA